MKGQYICTHCGKSMASSQSLWNHKQKCKGTAEREIPRVILEKPDNRTFNRDDPIPVVSQKNGRFVVEKEPGVKYFLDEMINDGIPEENAPVIPQTPLPSVQPSKKRKLFATMNHPPKRQKTDFRDSNCIMLSQNVEKVIL